MVVLSNAANIAATTRTREETVDAGRLDNREDRFARMVAIIVFGTGVALLFAVFWWTKDWFDSLAQANQEWLKKPVTPGTEPGIATYVPAFGAQVLRAGLLFVLGYLASSVATKGAQLFAAASPRRELP